MNKKLIIIFSLVIILQLAIIACCPEPQNKYRQINGISLKVGNFQTELEDSARVSVENFRLIVNFDNEAISFNSLSFLINNSQAISCHRSGYKGLKNRIKYIEIFTDKNFKGIIAGETIDHFFNAYLPHNYDDSKNKRFNINETIEEWNTDIYWYTWYLELTDKNVSNDFYTFTIKLIFEDGKELEGKTNTVKLTS